MRLLLCVVKVQYSRTKTRSFDVYVIFKSSDVENRICLLKIKAYPVLVRSNESNTFLKIIFKYMRAYVCNQLIFIFVLVVKLKHAYGMIKPK